MPDMQTGASEHEKALAFFAKARLQCLRKIALLDNDNDHVRAIAVFRHRDVEMADTRADIGHRGCDFSSAALGGPVIGKDLTGPSNFRMRSSFRPN
jgi:hypothetical protein